MTNLETLLHKMEEDIRTFGFYLPTESKILKMIEIIREQNKLVMYVMNNNLTKKSDDCYRKVEEIAGKK